MTRKFVPMLGASLALCMAQPSWAQFTKFVTDFEDAGWTEFVTVPMFRAPSFSTSTRGLSTTAGELTYLTNVTIDTFSVARSMPRSVAVYWGWQNSNNPSSWMRLETFNAEFYPNPAVHLGGKVRFWAAATAYTNASFTTAVTTGNLFLGIGIRETGQGSPQGENGGIGGDLEWVGVNAVLHQIYAGPDGICNTTADPGSDDVQLIAPGSPAGPGVVCIDAGPDGILQTIPSGDDVALTTPRGRFNIPSDGVMRLYEFDLPAEELAGFVRGFTGDGTLLGSPNNRGALSHLVITNDPGNAAVNANVWLLNIDDVEVESPVIDPPVIQTEPSPPRPLDVRIPMAQVDAAADNLEIVRLNIDGSETVLFSSDPNGVTPNVPVDPLASSIRVVARQTIGANESDDSVPVIVASPGNGPLRIAMAVRETDQYDNDPNVACGDDGTGFDPDQPSTLEYIGASGQTAGFGIPDAPRFTPQADWFELQFNPCDPEFGVAAFSGNGNLELNPTGTTVGVWEGLYFRVDEILPTPGPYTIYLDDMAVKDAQTGSIVCLIDDFEGYSPGRFIVGDFSGNGLADSAADPNSDDIQVVSVGSPVFGGQIIIDPGPDRILQTVRSGDDLYSYKHARFNIPGASGTSVGLADTPSLTRVTTEQAYSGSQSLEVQFAYTDASNLRSLLRLTTNGSLATNPPQTFRNPDPIIPFSLDGTFCDGSGDLVYSVMIRLAPPVSPADCDGDGDVDLHDIACLQLCYDESPLPGDCVLLDIAPRTAPDGEIDFDDVDLFRFLLIGPL